MPSSLRQFAVHAAHENRDQGHHVEGESFEAAAVAFVDAWHPTVDAEGDVAVIVREADSGHEQCFRIDVETGETRPCD